TNDGVALLADVGTRYETAVDLDRLERELVDVAERGIAGAEIVECETHACGGELLDEARGVCIVVEEQAFGYFELEPVGIEPRLAQGGQDAERGPGRADLDRREVDGDGHVFGPSGTRLCRLRGDPVAERDDHAGLLG